MKTNQHRRLLQLFSLIAFSMLSLNCARSVNKTIELNKNLTYTTKHTSLIKIFVGQYFLKRLYTKNTTLSLNKDSSFVLNTCGNIIKGRIDSISMNRLVLSLESSFKKRDSTLFKKDKPYGIQVFDIEKNGDLMDKNKISSGRFKDFYSYIILEQVVND